MAIGQLLDYRRFISEENVTCAVLVPEIPRPDLLQLLAFSGTYIYFPEKGAFVLMDARGKRYDNAQPIPYNPSAPCRGRRGAGSHRTQPLLAAISRLNGDGRIAAFAGPRRDWKIQDSFGPEARSVPNNSKHNVFIVHGHDHAARDAVTLFLHHIGLNPVILSEVEDSGRTIIEKFEQITRQADFAIVLLTPDDVTTNAGGTTRRARQNVVFELGYFVSKLGRDKVCLLRKDDVEGFSDFHGVIYQTMDEHQKWKTKLAQELKAAGLAFDTTRIFT